MFYLELHPEKTRIVYCKDGTRKDEQENISFDFLGYTFRPRRSRTKKGKIFLNFTPAISRNAKKRIKATIRGWKLPSRTGSSLEEIARWINPQVRGWINYYGKFNRSALYQTGYYIEYKLCLWASKKYKRLKRSHKKGRNWLRRIHKDYLGPRFAHGSLSPKK